MHNAKIVIQTAPLPQAQVVAGIGNIVVSDGATAGIQHNQVSPSASWNIVHDIGRVPNVQVFIDGQAVIADIEASPTEVNITFSQPQTGIAVLV